MSYDPPYRGQTGYTQQPWPPDHYQDRPAYADSFDYYQEQGYQQQGPFPGPGQAPEPASDWFRGDAYRQAGQPGYGQPGYGQPGYGRGGFGGGRHQAMAQLRRGPGVIAGAVMGLLAAAMSIAVATLAAAFFRPQASPIIAVGEAFIDRTPPALKNFAVEKFGENDKTMLLLGMYITIALLAMAIGVLARQRVAIGVAGIVAFGLFGAFVAYTRPASRPTDVIPAFIGVIAGVLALLWLAHAAAPEVERG